VGARREESHWLFYAFMQRKLAVSSAGGGTPVDLQEWFEVGVGTHDFFFIKKFLE